MPIGANDFSTEAYSYDETDRDFSLKNFSIAHDEKTLVPFIQAALRYQPNLKLWASPWSPPSWMKRNHFYAEAKAYPGMKENGIRPDQIGHEGEDMFIQDPMYFEAYARYFGRYIDAYRAKGISIDAHHIFPSLIRRATSFFFRFWTVSYLLPTTPRTSSAPRQSSANCRIV